MKISANRRPQGTSRISEPVTFLDMGNKFQESWRRAVRRHPDLTDGQKVVLLALHDYQDHETRTACPKVETLMDDCNLGERTVRKATSQALKFGLLVKVASAQNVRESGNTANVWAFTLPEVEF